MGLLEDLYQFRFLKEADFDEVWSIIEDVYNAQDPVSQKIKSSPEELRLTSEEYVKIALTQHVSMGAFDKKTKQMVAISISILGKHLKESAKSPNLPLKVKQMLALDSYFLGDDAAITLGTKDYMEYFILATRPAHTNRGIATELYKRSDEVAKSEGCTKIFTLASSYYTKRIVAKFGFVAQKSFLYSDYVDPVSQEKIFDDMPEPHKSCALFVKEI